MARVSFVEAVDVQTTGYPDYRASTLEEALNRLQNKNKDGTLPQNSTVCGNPEVILVNVDSNKYSPYWSVIVHYDVPEGWKLA